MRADNREIFKVNTRFTAFEFLARMRERWYFFVISCVFCLSVGWHLADYIIPEYYVRASLLLSDNSRGVDFGDPALQDMGLYSRPSSVDNELELLRSRSLIETVVTNQKLYVLCRLHDGLKSRELYLDCPFEIEALAPNVPHKPLSYSLRFWDKRSFTICGEAKLIAAKTEDTLFLPSGKVIIHSKRAISPDTARNYSIYISPPDEAVGQYRSKISIVPVNKIASIVNLSITEEIPGKGEDILAELIKVYLGMSKANESRLADSTLTFIDQNLLEVSHRLFEAEQEIETFRKAHLDVDAELGSQIIFENLTNASAERRDLLVKQKLVEMLRRQLILFPDRPVPASLFHLDGNFADLSKKLNDLWLVKKQESVTGTSRHPLSMKTDSQIVHLQEKLLALVHAQGTHLEFQLKQNKVSSRNLQQERTKIPGVQRQFTALLRTQEIQQELYQFLLRKRMETSISKSSNFAKAQIVDPPKADSAPLSPNRRLIMALALLTGLALPALGIIWQEAFQTRITSKAELAEITKIPVIGEISHERPAIKWLGRGTFDEAVSEQFRILRTNIQIFLPASSLKKIMVTSGISGEGKSYVALNLAKVFALTAKRVLLIELDLRRPVFAAKFGLKDTGIADLFASNVKIQDVIQPFPYSERFDILTSGRPPTLPSEMLLLPRLNEILDQLAYSYDYIIIDTPPIGIITDARIIANHVDLSLFVVRIGHTAKEQVFDISSHFYRLTPPFIILNGVGRNESYEYGYQKKTK